MIRDMRRILKKRCKGLIQLSVCRTCDDRRLRRWSDRQEEMAWFLSQNCFVSMSRLGTGEGPGDSVVLPLVDWSKLKMMKGGSGWKQG